MKDDILFDSDKCIWKRDFGYDSMPLKEFDEYANIAATFIGHFIGKKENVSIEINRLKKKFRIIVRHNDMNDTEYGVSFCDLEAGYYKNGNVKWLDNFFGILNNEYGLAANNLRIPKYPTSSGDGYYEWWETYKQMRNFKMDFAYKEGKGFSEVWEKIYNLKRKYFENWEYRL